MRYVAFGCHGFHGLRFLTNLFPVSNDRKVVVASAHGANFAVWKTPATHLGKDRVEQDVGRANKDEKAEKGREKRGSFTEKTDIAKDPD